MTIKNKNEASVVAAIKGFQPPLGAKKSKKNNPSKPYGEDELFESLVAKLELSERIEKRGDDWIVIDPRTGVQVDRAPTRDAAREKQKQHGITVPRDPLKSGEAEPEKKSNKSVKKRRPSDTVRVEDLKVLFKKFLKEQNMLSYMFESNDDGSLWESFVGNLPKEAVMQDKGLSEVLREIAKTEARVLAQSVYEIKKVLESLGAFQVERREADQDPTSGDVRMPFMVSMMSESGQPQKVLFGVKLESGRPTILFPEETRYVLNNALTRDSKLLRAELLHLQETVLDGISDVLEACSKRDAYLKEMHGRLREMVGGLNLVETALLKGLIREKLKGAR